MLLDFTEIFGKEVKQIIVIILFLSFLAFLLLKTSKKITKDEKKKNFDFFFFKIQKIAHGCIFESFLKVINVTFRTPGILPHDECRTSSIFPRNIYFRG